MKGGARTALAIGVGYILGRRRKMRMATALAIGAATGGLGGLAPAALKRGAKLLGSTDIGNALGPQVGDIVSTVRGDLLDAGKAAATAAVTSRIDSLSDNLHDRAETLRNPADAAAETGRSAGEAVQRRTRRHRDADEGDEAAERDDDGRRDGRARRERSSEPDEVDARNDDIDEDEPDDYEPVDADEPADEPVDEAADEPADDIDEEDADEAAPRRSRTRSPVSRTRR